jgi:hypothetical protein
MPGGRGKITGREGHTFTKGDPRINRKGRPRKLPALDTLLVEILGRDAGGTTELHLVIEALLKKAKAGDVRSAEILLDRVYGKVPAQLSFDSLTTDQLEQLHAYLKRKHESTTEQGH